MQEPAQEFAEKPAALSPLFSPAGNRAAVLHELRRLLPSRLAAQDEAGKAGTILPFGLPALDDHLPDGDL